ncbi:MAG TPA: outer membrane lipoprotein carrier protein LolA [Candidatus Polarisedimenticolaceae bacterium]
MILRTFAAAVLLSAPVAPAAEPVPALAAVESWLKATRTLEGRFEQTLLSGALGTGLTESGRLWIERPGRMRWDYERPERKVALVNGEHTALYLEAEQQWIRGRLGEESELLPALLAGNKPMSELFTASDAGAGRLRLRPREANAGALEEILLVFRRDTGAIEGAEILDAAGNRTAYRFEGWKRNRKLPDGVFAFEPPPGTEFVDAQNP